VTYNSGVLRALLLAVPLAAVAGVMILLHAVDAGPDAGFAALCLISVINGVGVGLYVSRRGGRHREGRVASASRRTVRAGR
jgi:hypothetical protein